jgi:aminoglycoside phosphotransferase
VDALAEVTRALHALPVDECPLDRSLATVAPEAREAAARGRIDLGDLDHERQGWTATQLVAALDEQLTVMSDREVLAGHCERRGRPARSDDRYRQRGDRTRPL